MVLRLRSYAPYIVAAITVLTLTLITHTVRSQQDDTISLAISPQVFEVTANPGDFIENQLRLTNGSPNAIQIETIPKNFTPVGEEGAVDLTEETTGFSLAQWVTVSPSSLTIPANSTQDFAITINVPSNAEPGGHFGSVVFKTIPPAAGEGAGAQVSQEIAPVILVEIAGESKESAQLASFASAKSIWTLAGEDKNINLETRLENTGNVHFKPKGTITIKNMFGSEVASLTLDEKNVLPSSIRKITTSWQPSGFSVGKYTADLTLVYGDNDQLITASTSFIVFPYRTVLPAVLILGLSLFVLIRYRNRFGAALKALSGK